MNQFNSFVIKETKHIMRDRRTMLILFGMPVVMMLVFGFAITTDIKDVKVAIVTSSMDSRTQQVVNSLDASGNFIVTHTVGTTKEAKQLLSDNKVNMAIAFSPDFGNNRTAVRLAFNLSLIIRIRTSLNSRCRMPNKS